METVYMYEKGSIKLMLKVAKTLKKEIEIFPYRHERGSIVY